MKRALLTVNILVVSTALIFTTLAFGETVTLRVASGWFHPNLTIADGKNLCELPDATYDFGKSRFGISHDNENRCWFSNLSRCKQLILQPDHQHFKCDEVITELDGVPENKLQVHDLSLLSFTAEKPINQCQRLYSQNQSRQQSFFLSGNEVQIKISTSTDSFFRECKVSGDLAMTSSSRTCSRVYFSKYGIICSIGSSSHFIAFRKNIPISELVEAVINHYRPEDYNFSLSCEEHRYLTKWTSTTSPNFAEEIHLDETGAVREILASLGSERYVHHFDRDGRYIDVLKLDKLVARPRSLQTTADAYEPAITKQKKQGPIVFWTNYLSSLHQCCANSECRTAFRPTTPDKTRLPANNSELAPSSQTGLVADRPIVHGR